VLVTHQLQYLPQCDSIIVMSNGTISAQGKLPLLNHSVPSVSFFPLHWLHFTCYISIVTQNAGTFSELMNKVDFANTIEQHVDLTVSGS
jgi:energy-coupling factor transporter ATP-binding protein EcfA2